MSHKSDPTGSQEKENLVDVSNLNNRPSQKNWRGLDRRSGPQNYTHSSQSIRNRFNSGHGREYDIEKGNSDMIDEIVEKETEKYESYHRSVFWFFMIFMILGLIGMVLVLLEQTDERFKPHRGFIGIIVIPIYTLFAAVMVLTRNNFFLNNASTHAFSFIFGYSFGFATFVMFASFLDGIKSV